MRVFLYIMHIAFVEIRASKSLDASKKFADIFHNLPMMLANRENDEENERIHEELLKRARRSNLEGYLKDLRRMAEARAN